MRRLVLIIFFFAVLAGCNNGTDKLGTGGRLFNDYQGWFTSISQPTKSTLDTTLTIRFRGFGSEAEKQTAWDKQWRSKHPEWGPVQQATVSGFPIEIWFDIREIPKEGLLLPPHIIGHEVIHAIKIARPEAIDSDSFAMR